MKHMDIDIAPPALDTCRAAVPPGLRIALGIDTVQVDDIEASLASFGVRFENRLFTPAELADARAVEGGFAERLAARFAAKEATIKAFALTQCGIDWREIEVLHAADGRPRLRLHGEVAKALTALGATTIDLSLSHDGRQAVAIVAGLLESPSE
jgi:holo-[acyl-carrier protein] synthase